MEKTYHITMNVNLWNYAQKVGNGSITAGLVKIISLYKDEDPEYHTPEVEVAESINNAASTASTSAIPSDIADKLIALNEATDKEAVESGRVMTEEEGRATLYELSAYNYVIHGDTKPDAIRAYIKTLDGSFQKSCQKLKGAAVWRIPKSNIDKLGIDNVIKAFAEVGLTVTIGESLMTEEERAKAAEKASATKTESKPKEKKEGEKSEGQKGSAAKKPAAPIVLSIAPKPVTGLCFEPKKSVENGFEEVTRELQVRDGYYYYQGSKGAAIYIKVGKATQKDAEVFVCIAKVQGQMTELAESDDTKKWTKVAELGVVTAVKKKLTTPTVAMAYALAEVGAAQKDVTYIWEAA